MINWNRIQKTWRGISRRSWLAAAAVAVTLSANACGRAYEPVDVPETAQTPVNENGTGDNSTGDKGTEDNGVSFKGAGSDAAGTGTYDGAAGHQETDPADAESSVLETTLMTETAPLFSDVDETVYVTGNQVNLRTGANTTAEVFAVLNKGTSLKRTAVSDTWSRVMYQEKTCYISTQYLSTTQPETEAPAAAASVSGTEVKLNPSWKYADFTKINSGAAILYKSEAASRKGITVCVNAGHGTKGGSSVKTQCHPDGTPKVTGGTTGAGATTAVAVSSGMQFSDGTAEAKVTLAMAKKFKEKLLAAGYDVLMIRETDDVQLDNIARTVIANNMADCHISLHWDSTTNNKGAFYMSVPNVSSYRNMEPVKSNWEKHNALGESLVSGLKSAGVKIFSNGAMEMDLTQTSYSTVPSIDIELGDKASDHSDATLNTLADGLVKGVDGYFS